MSADSRTRRPASPMGSAFSAQMVGPAHATSWSRQAPGQPVHSSPGCPVCTRHALLRRPQRRCPLHGGSPALSGPKDTHRNGSSQTCLLRPTAVQERNNPAPQGGLKPSEPGWGDTGSASLHPDLRPWAPGLSLSAHVRRERSSAWRPAAQTTGWVRTPASGTVSNRHVAP